MEELPYNIVLILSVTAVVLAIIEIIILCRVLNNQETQSKLIINVVKENTEMSKAVKDAMNKISDAQIRQSERSSGHHAEMTANVGHLKELIKDTKR